jgi:hypothetical protein
MKRRPNGVFASIQKNRNYDQTMKKRRANHDYTKALSGI